MIQKITFAGNMSKAINPAKKMATKTQEYLSDGAVMKNISQPVKANDADAVAYYEAMKANSLPIPHPEALTSLKNLPSEGIDGKLGF